MLFNTLRRAKYTYIGDYYGYTTITSADGLVSSNVYATAPTSIQFALSTSFVGDIVILTDSKLQLKGRITDILDRNNNPIYVDGEWETVGKRSGGGGLVTQVISRSRYHAAAQQNLSVTFFNETRQHASRSNIFGLVSNICAPPGAWTT